MLLSSSEDENYVKIVVERCTLLERARFASYAIVFFEAARRILSSFSRGDEHNTHMNSIHSTVPVFAQNHAQHDGKVTAVERT